MFLARVLLGESCLGTKGMARPKQKPGLHTLFESMVDRLDDPSIFVLGAGTDDHACEKSIGYRVYSIQYSLNYMALDQTTKWPCM
jgi:hypothetical protein